LTLADAVALIKAREEKGPAKKRGRRAPSTTKGAAKKTTKAGTKTTAKTTKKKSQAG
jgi:hypothetical protein